MQVAQACDFFLLRLMWEDQGSRPTCFLTRALSWKSINKTVFLLWRLPFSLFVLMYIPQTDTLWLWSFPNQPCWVPVCKNYRRFPHCQTSFPDGSYTQENASGCVFRLSDPLRHCPTPFQCWAGMEALSWATASPQDLAPQFCIWRWYLEAERFRSK